MEPEIMSTVVESGTALASLVGSGLTKVINTKIQALKTEKSADKVRAAYDELITQILQERADAILLAQSYKAELDKINISDDDIQHLQKTLERILNIFISMKSDNVDPDDSNTLAKIKAQNDSLAALKELVNADTLKTMQLLGFNYKAAIGEPLTEICAEAIKQKLAINKNQTNQNHSAKKR